MPFSDYRIEDQLDIFSEKGLMLAAQGAQEIEWAKNEMKALILLKQEYQSAKPLKGARIAGSLHVTIPTALLIEILTQLGAEVRWSACNPFSTQSQAAAALAKKEIPVFAWKGMSDEDYQWALKQTLKFSSGPPNMILDDGGDLSLLIHQEYPHICKDIRGITEETTTGIRRLNELQRKEKLKIPVMNVNDSITKSKFDNYYGCRESFIDGLKRATNLMIAGKTAVVAGYGDVGKGISSGLKAYGAHIIVTEVDPIKAYQALMDGFRVMTMDEACMLGDLFVTATGCIQVIEGKHMEKMKDQAILCNMGHFNKEIDIDWLSKQSHIIESLQRKHVKSYRWKDSKKELLVIAEGRLVNLVAAEGHPNFIMAGSFANQVLAQIELWNHPGQYSIGIHKVPEYLDEKVAKLQLRACGAHLSKLSPTQASYLGIRSQHG